MNDLKEEFCESSEDKSETMNETINLDTCYEEEIAEDTGEFSYEESQNETMDASVEIEEDVGDGIKHYEENGYEFEKNDKGQILKASGDLVLEEGVRDTQAQRNAGGEDRRDDDDGGHLIGTRFNGPGGEEYLVPENYHVNRSVFRSFENSWAEELKDGNQVHVDIEPVYHGESKRPDLITGKYDVTEDGKTETEYFSMTNENLDSDEFELPEEDETDIYPNAMDTVYEKYGKELEENVKINRKDWRRV